MDGWNTSFLLGWPISMGYVSFREGISSIHWWKVSLRCRRALWPLDRLLSTACPMFIQPETGAFLAGVATVRVLGCLTSCWNADPMGILGFPSLRGLCTMDICLRRCRTFLFVPQHSWNTPRVWRYAGCIQLGHCLIPWRARNAARSCEDHLKRKKCWWSVTMCTMPSVLEIQTYQNKTLTNSSIVPKSMRHHETPRRSFIG